VDTVLDHKHLKEELESKRAVVSAQIERLQAQLKATEDQMAAEASQREAGTIDDQRRFAVDVENARIDVLRIKTQLETDQMSLEQLQLDKKIFVADGRLQQQGASIYDLKKTEVAYSTLEKKIEDSRFLLSQAESNLQYAQKRLEDFLQRQVRHPSVDLALDVIRKEILVQEKTIDDILQGRVALVISSPFKGVVSAIQRSPGEAVLPGEPILSISETEPREIIAFFNRSEVARIRPNMNVEIAKEGDPQQIARSQITHLGPDVQLMPGQLRLSPDVPQWGRPVLIKIPPGFKLIPGELVRIRIL
jgi:multidrug resistance efflux pump